MTFKIKNYLKKTTWKRSYYKIFMKIWWESIFKQGIKLFRHGIEFKNVDNEQYADQFAGKNLIGRVSYLHFIIIIDLFKWSNNLTYKAKYSNSASSFTA